jgi:hypothetical protein
LSDDQASGEDFFDASFLGELEELAGASLARPASWAAVLEDHLGAFLAPVSGQGAPLDEQAFVDLPMNVVSERTNALIEACRQGGVAGASQAIESFVVFFQALLPTLPEGSAEVRRLFFRLAPTLLHIAHNDFGDTQEARRSGRESLRGLETILLEISSVRLAPSERDLVYRSIDQMSSMIAVGEYALADRIISSQLLSLIRRNKLTRALYRIMEVEVNVQNYLRERLGYRTPQIRVPDDVAALADYGPVRVLEETDVFGDRHQFLQVQIPDVPILRDIVLRLVETTTGATHDLRMDALGSARLDVPSGTYGIGLVYEPDLG